MRGTKKYKIVKCFRHFGAIIILLWLISIVRFPYSFDKLQVLSNKNFESVSNSMLTLVDCKSTESKSSIDFLLTDGKQYYIKNVTASPVVICEAGELTNTSNTGIYKKKIYYYGADGQLYTCNLKGESQNVIGNVERFFVGSYIR